MGREGEGGGWEWHLTGSDPSSQMTVSGSSTVLMHKLGYSAITSLATFKYSGLHSLYLMKFHLYDSLVMAWDQQSC